jgi:hypothetical protein
MAKRNQEPAADRERVAIGRRDLLRGAAAAGIATVGAIVQTTPSGAVIWEEGEEQCRASVAEKDPGYDIDDALLGDFMDVSRTLTGMPLSSVSDLRIGREYLERFARIDVPGIDLRKLIAAHADSAETLMKNTAVRPAAEQLIYLWYLSAFLLPTKTGPAWIYGTTEQYERGLLWTAIGAHAPMMPMRGSEPRYWANEGHLPFKGTAPKKT